MVYTIARSGEARNALAVEIKGNVWVIPGHKMKAGKAHRVPLVESARQCFVSHQTDELLFSNKGKPLSDMAISMLLRKAGFPFVPHDIRSCFRSWCAVNKVDFEVAELCLAHNVLTKVQRSYQRDDLLDERRQVLERWGQTLNA